MKSVFDKCCNAIGIILIGVAGTFLINMNVLANSSYPNQGCSNLGFRVGISSPLADSNGVVEVSGLKENTVIAYLVLKDFSGVCDTGYSTSTNVNDTPPGKGFVVYDTPTCNNGIAQDLDGIVGIYCSDKDGARTSGILEFNGDHGPAPVTELTSPHPFVLKSKNFIGKKVIQINQITNGFARLYSTWGAYTWNLKATPGNVWNEAQELVLSYTPTCSASVNNVDFGSRTVDEIKKGMEETVNIEISCNDILPKYSINISSDFGGSNSTINSGNSTLGYQLTWGDLSKSGLSADKNNTPVILGMSVSPDNGKRPGDSSFNIPLLIKPVPLRGSFADILPGRADSRININLQFN